MIQEQSSLLQGLLSGHKLSLRSRFGRIRVKIFSLKLFITLQATLNMFALKKRPQKTATKFREDDTSAKTDAHISYDTKYEMIHNFF